MEFFTSELIIYLGAALIVGLILGWLFGVVCANEKCDQELGLDIKSGDLGLGNCAKECSMERAECEINSAKSTPKTKPVAKKKAPAKKATPKKKVPVAKKAPVKKAAPAKKKAVSVVSGNSGLEIETVEGIGEVYGQKLRAMKIETTGALLKANKSAPKKLRTDVEASLKVKDTVVNSWVSMADLLRVDGIDKQYAELLNDSGINDVAALAKASNTGLATKAKKINDDTGVAPKAPTATELKNIIANAKKLV